MTDEPWRKHIRLNELNKNSRGGSEIMYENVVKRVWERDPTLLDGVQIICSRVREIDVDKKIIYWLHDLPDDPETSHLQHEWSRSRFDKIVFCGQWQAQQYRNTLGVPFDSKSCVIETASAPIQNWNVSKPKDKVKLIYTSTPQRGLDLLVPAFEYLAERHDNIELDVFSSFAIYGWAQSDSPFEPLFERCRQHPKINYHGFQPNEDVRKAVSEAHIFAYPSIWMECNSKALIEAMSGGCICIHPNLAGLADTSGGLTMMYDWDRDPQVHVNKFVQVLDFAIKHNFEPELDNYRLFVSEYANRRFDWNKITNQWVGLLQEVKST